MNSKLFIKGQDHDRKKGGQKIENNRIITLKKNLKNIIG